jgi:hypothetical protein
MDLFQNTTIASVRQAPDGVGRAEYPSQGRV